LKIGIGMLFENFEGKILLMLRDDKKTISFPNTWYIPGGKVENYETPENAVVRETREEFELEINDFILFNKYIWKDKIEYIYYKKLNFDISKINLHEGQEIRWWNLGAAKKIKLAFNDNKILEDFINSKK
jgi:8-oxo-dGTP diphosphatase